ncbi:probable mediator of RNA polymerase II transcription subunit 26c isoform X2 [Miscanthus floridulus]|uniref:probable mediator of RNA polymerase II transcription subunit 26c isoform X2 n=1 Tax=Miscanthus floridulus TaxID=154761 RepID=UPI00345A12FA
MDRGERLGRALDAFGGDLWALVDAALDVAARDHPDELRARRDGIVERLYAAAAAAGCSNCAGRPPPLAALAAAGLDEEGGEEAAPASPVVEADAQAGGAEELGAGAGAPGLESKIVAIRDFLDDPNQPEDELVRLLQNLADMGVTYNALQATDIGRQVNGLRKHPSAEVRRLVKQLIRKWKEIVDDWVRLHNSGGDGSTTVMTDGDSPDKIQGRSHQSPRVSGFQYSPSPQRQNGTASERANNGFESTMDAKRRASPVPAHHNSKQMNNHHNSTTSTSSAPAKVTREQRQSLLDLDKLDSARKRLQENYQEAQNAKKQRTIQVMDINDIPKPKSRNAFIRKSGSDGLPARHR